MLSIATTSYKWPWIYFPEMSFTDTGSGFYLITVMILFLSLLFSILSLKCRGIYLTIYMVKLFLKMVPRNWQNISTILGIFLMVFVVSQASLILHSCFLCLFFPVWVFLTYLGVVVCCLSLILKNSTSLFSLKHYLFIYLGLYWVFVALCGLSLVVWTGATLHCDLHASHRGGFSCYRAWAPVHLGFSSRGTWVVVAPKLQSTGSVNAAREVVSR